MTPFEPERLEQQMAFLREIDREKFVLRQTYLHDGSRKENDAEHAWHLAMFVLVLSEYANEEHGIRFSQVPGRNQRSREGSEILWEYMLTHFIEPHVRSGELKPD